jgi:uncharacterized protein (DUF58 family)
MLPERFTPQYLRQLELFKLRARRAFLGSRQGGHISLKRGHGIEFSDYRQYQLGDNPRHIDWALYGRSERLYVKRFAEEQDLSLMILLDASASMSTPVADRKWDYAKDLALSLAYIALMEQDSVLLPMAGATTSPRYHGGRAIHRLSKDLADLQTGVENDLARAARSAASRLRFPCVAVVVSDFLMPLEECIQVFTPLRAKNLDITALQVLGPSDLDGPASDGVISAIDSESGELLEIAITPAVREEYRAHLTSHVASVREYLASAQITLVQADTRVALSEFVIQSLPRTGLLR